MRTQKLVVLISLGIMFLSTLLVIYFSKRISKPIVILSGEINKIQQLELGSEMRVESHIKEINLLDTSIAAMRQSLAD